MDKTNDMTSPTLPEPIASLGTVNLGVADDGVIMVGEKPFMRDAKERLVRGETDLIVTVEKLCAGVPSASV